MRQTESISREDKIVKFARKTFFYFALKAIMCENNTFNTNEALQIDKKVHSDCNSYHEETVEKKRDSQDVMQEISFS